MINKLEETIKRLEDLQCNPKKEGKNYRAKCPACDSTDNRVLTIFDNEDNKVGFHCHKGCTYEDIINSIGLNEDFQEIEREVYYGSNVLKKYPYTDLKGNILYYKNRLQGKFFNYSHIYKGQEYKGRGHYQSVLYNLPGILNANDILLVEGEKDADNLNRMGLIATTKDSTSRNLYNGELESLKNKNVVLFYDNDTTGLEALEKNKDQLGLIVKSLKVVHLPMDKPKGYDISDYIEEYNPTKKDIIQLINQAENIPTGKYRNLYNYYSYNDYIPNIDKNKDKFEFTTDKGMRTTNQNRVLNYLITHIPLITVNNNHYLYDKGVYKLVTRNKINMIVQDHLLGDYKTNTLRNGIASLWINDRSVMKNPEVINNMVDLSNKKLLLNLKNGIYNVLTKELKDHSYKDYSTIQIKANYNPNLNDSNGLIFNKFLNEVAPDPDTQILLQEILGYSISPLNNAKKSFILYGDSNTGKSIFLGLITGLLGQENISAVPFQQLDNRFSTASLYGKTVNVCADLPKGAINDDSVFKQLTGGDIMKAEFKGQDEFEFINTAKLIFSTNSLPENYGDESNAFYNRLIIIPFNQVIPEEKQDKNLNLKLNKELDYIFMWGLEGLERLIQNNMQFSISQESKELLENYKVSKTDNTIELIKDLIDRGFLKEHYHYKYINNKTELALYTTGVYEVIINYSNSYLSKEDKKFIHMSRKDFQESIRKENYFLDYKPVNMSGKSKRCYVVKNYELEVISN